MAKVDLPSQIESLSGAFGSVIFRTYTKRDGTEKPERAFEVLYYGWRLARIHETQKSAEHFHNIRKRGWMDEEDAKSFCNYCISGWEPPDE